MNAEETVLPGTPALPAGPACAGTDGGEPALVVKDLFHRFKKTCAVNCISFSVERGSIHGFVGPNGAGKTTTLKIIATLLKPTRGTVRVFGYNVVHNYKLVRGRLGFMPDHFSMYRQMSVYEYLDFFAAAYGFGVTDRNRIIGDVLELTDMGGRQDSLIKSLSRGMQQRVSLARVLVHDPALLLLDEPASGLDPRARIELMEILKELRRMGKTIFISSHILSELADLCDSVTILDSGELRYSGGMVDLLQREVDGIAIYVMELATPHEKTVDALRSLAGITGVEPAEETGSYAVAYEAAALRPNDILEAVLAAGGEVVSFRRDRRHLNEAFMDLTSAGVPS